MQKPERGRNKMNERQEKTWNERDEVEWLKYTVQPPMGVIKGEYYHAERRFGGNDWSEGHLGELTVVKGDDGKLIFVEFNETAMEGYYNQYFDSVSKRRSDYGIWQASAKRQADAGVVLTDGMLHIEKQIMESQSLDKEFDLLTGASNSMRGLLPLAKELAEEIQNPSSRRYYSAAENFGYGISGWLQVVVENGRILSCFYDEIFADTQEEIWYPELKRYYKQSKYHSPCFEEPNIPGWKNHGFFIGFRKLMDILNKQIVERQDLFDIDGLKHVDGMNAGAIWNRHAESEDPIGGCGSPIRYPVWDNYLKLAEMIQKEIDRERRE